MTEETAAALFGAIEEVLARWAIAKAVGASLDTCEFPKALMKLDIACEAYYGADAGESQTAPDLSAALARLRAWVRSEAEGADLPEHYPQTHRGMMDVERLVAAVEELTPQQTAKALPTKFEDWADMYGWKR